MASQIALDDVDRGLLHELLMDARQSYHKLASKLGIAVGTVRARIQRLEKSGVIIDYSVRLNHEIIGYTLTAVTEVTVSKGKLLETEKEIATWPFVCAVYDITGLTDVLVIAKFRTREDLSSFTKRLLSLPFVERTNTHVVLSSAKEDFRLL
ncbi:MAG: Lrp/AsnC family transcriptional regulator [Nitrososphaerota archaeon]